MVRSYSVQGNSNMQIPVFWKQLLALVALGKAAFVGASLALAVLGALDIAFAATAAVWLETIQKEYINYFALGGGIVGALIKVIFMR